MEDAQETLRSVVIPKEGRDEFNLAEFPITLLTDRVPAGLKTLEYSDEITDKLTGLPVKRKVIITGSDAWGLPTAAVADVLVGMVHLTKQGNGFTSRVVPFSRYEFLRLLGWRDEGKSYRRLEHALNCLAGVTLYFSAWRDKQSETWMSETFHLIDNVSLVNRVTRRTLQLRGQQELALSSFAWNQIVFRNLQAGYVGPLDLELYFSLGSSVAKRMLRYLSKHFRLRQTDVLTYELGTFAFDKVGITRSDNVAKVKATLNPPLRELEQAGFLRPTEPEQRYSKLRPGQWTITLTKAAGKPKAASRFLPLPEPTHPERELTGRGVTPATAAELVASFAGEQIAAQVEVFDWLSERKDKRIGKNPAGYLVDSIRKGYKAPKGFESKADREKREAESRERQRAEAETRRLRAEQEARQREEQRKIAAFLDSLSGDALLSFDAEAFEHATPEDRATLERYQRQPVGRAMIRLIRETHARRKLGLSPALEDTPERPQATRHTPIETRPDPFHPLPGCGVS